MIKIFFLQLHKQFFFHIHVYWNKRPAYLYAHYNAYIHLSENGGREKGWFISQELASSFQNQFLLTQNYFRKTMLTTKTYPYILSKPRLKTRTPHQRAMNFTIQLIFSLKLNKYLHTICIAMTQNHILSKKIISNFLYCSLLDAT